jgi:glycerol transport system permease protein
MDVWHWTSLVALLAYAGLQSIPDAYYQAAKIDQASRWSVFRYIELPKMMGVLMIAILLRFMDSFMIYTEPFVVTGGGPGSSTNFLSIDLVKIALGQFDLGPAAAYSIMYFLVILADFMGVLHRHDQSRQEGWRVMINRKAIVMALYLGCSCSCRSTGSSI